MSKFFLSTLVIFVLLFSGFAKTKTKKCPVRIPDSLISLYVKSDLIVIAELKSEKVEKVLNEGNDYKNLLTKQTLQVSKTLKGIHSPSVAVYKNEYRYKNDENSSGELIIDDGEMEIPSYQIGEKALFFLKKDEQKQLRATDYNGVKKLDNASLSIYEKRIKELSSIVKNKKNQAEKLTEWLVKCAEESATQWEGIYEINRSLNILSYEKEEAEEAEKAKDSEEVEAEKEAEETLEMFADNNFNNSSEIAKSLTDSQKERLITVYLNTINKDISNVNKDARSYINWELIDLVQKFDKQRVIYYLYAQFQNLKSEKNAVLYLMENISNMTDDEELYEIQRKFEQTLGKNDKDLVFEEEIEESETNKELSKEIKSDKKITYAEYRATILDDFDNRYQTLATRNFVKIIKDVEAETVESNETIINAENVDN